LRQTGLYDEFNTLRNAQRSAQQSVDDAKGFATVLEKTAKTSGEKLKSEQRLAEKATSRLEDVLKTAETTESLAKRITAAGKAPSSQASFVTRQQQQQDLLNTFDDSISSITRATKPDEVVSVVKATAKTLRNKNLISSAQFDDLMRDAEKLSTQADAQTKARKILAGVAVAIGAPAIGLRVMGSPSSAIGE
jgi:predicted O-linked N-acetylglucosamine transferase (SPINDLY family)